MNEKKSPPEYIILRDHENYCYVIPACMGYEFNQVLTDPEGDEFERKFSHYKVDGIVHSRAVLDYMNKQLVNTGLTPVHVTSDNEGHKYVIPAEMAEEFSRLLDGGESTEDEFIERFSQYMTGGDINQVQLYMKVETPEDIFIELSKQKSLPTDEQLSVDAMRIMYNVLAGVELTSWDRITLRLHLEKIMEPKKPSALEMVEEFHQAFGCPVLKTPTIPDYTRAELRCKLINEEAQEVLTAIVKEDMIGILDGLCDLLYVVYGTAHEYGLGPVLKEAIREVHRSNMSKLNGDGTPIIRNDGKVLKGPNYTPPDLEGILNKAVFGVPQPKLPEWDTETWRKACDKAMKEGYKDNYERQVIDEQPPADGNY
jgi:predicted HAD superfamily Cof-like phosphohydrolase